jgi:pimeloyl-ACP methyl ester carboxylesterase
MPLPRERTAFVLVPGAWHGGWCYSRVAQILRERGHVVYTPTLTGVGERSHLARLAINCSTHVQDVLNVIRWERLQRVVLCGHSYGGVVIGAVADRIPEHVASLVYLDAAVPESGKSFLELIVGPEQIAQFVAATADQGGGMLPPFPAAALDVNPADRAMVDELCTPHPFATLAERLTLSGAHAGIARKTYVFATRWQASLYRTTHARLADDQAWTVHEIACGHDVMLDAPQRLSAILTEAM